MLRITARINIGDGGGNITEAEDYALYRANGASSLDECIGHHTQIQKPFFFGRSRLGGGQCYTKKANFYISKQVADSNGNFPRTYTFHIEGENLTQLIIIFNKRDNEFPKSINVDGDTFYDDDSQWTIPLTHGGISHSIFINNWNTPNSPLVISSIYADLSIDIDDTNLLDFERTIMSKDNYSQPSFGIISNSGSLSFIDKDGEVVDLVTQRLININSDISIYLYNTETDIKEQIGYFNTKQMSYNYSQQIFDITLKDDLDEWQSINVPAINYTPTVSTIQTAEWLYKKLYNLTPTKYNMLSFDELDEATKTVLSGTTIQYPVLDSDNLWAEWTKLCELCFLNIYKDNSGRTVCKYSGG